MKKKVEKKTYREGTTAFLVSLREFYDQHPNGWCQFEGKITEKDGVVLPFDEWKFCLMNLMYYLASNKRIDIDDYREARLILSNCIDDSATFINQNIVKWNDQEGRTIDEVIDLIDIAIEESWK